MPKPVTHVPEKLYINPTSLPFHPHLGQLVATEHHSHGRLRSSPPWRLQQPQASLQRFASYLKHALFAFALSRRKLTLDAISQMTMISTIAATSADEPMRRFPFDCVASF